MCVYYRQIALIKEGVFRLVFERGKNLTSIGQPYYNLRLEYYNRVSEFRLWASELLWLRDVLKRIVLIEKDKLPQEDGSYPLVNNLMSSGGICILLEIKQASPFVVFRRYQASMSKNEETIYTRYFNYIPRFQLKIPFDLFDAQLLENKLNNYLEEQKQCFINNNTYLGFSENDEIESILSRTYVRDIKNCEELRLLQPGNLELINGDCELLPKDISNLVVENCQLPSTIDDIQRKIGLNISKQDIKQIVDYTRRYSMDVLGKSFSMGWLNAKEIVAIRSREVFATDPLLTSLLDWRLDNCESDNSYIDIIQCESNVLEYAFNVGNCTNRISTMHGMINIPTDEKKKNISAFFAPTNGLKMNRWKILQILELESCGFCNLPFTDISMKTFSIQKLGLLISDANELFKDISESINAWLDNYRKRWNNFFYNLKSWEKYNKLPERSEND